MLHRKVFTQEFQQMSLVVDIGYSRKYNYPLFN